jgi:hypothetical protein
LSDPDLSSDDLVLAGGPAAPWGLAFGYLVGAERVESDRNHDIQRPSNAPINHHPDLRRYWPRKIPSNGEKVSENFKIRAKLLPPGLWALSRFPRSAAERERDCLLENSVESVWLFGPSAKR